MQISRGSKLDHYAADPALLQTTVGVHRTYLERLSAEPLSISIPPPAAGKLQFFTSEAISLLGRFAREETIAAIRTVRDITFEPVYNKYRLALAAEVNISDAARQLLKNKRAEAAKKDCCLYRKRLTLHSTHDRVHSMYGFN